ARRRSSPMSPPSSESSRFPTAPAPPSLPSARAWWARKDDPSGEPFAWLRFLIAPLVVAGAFAADPADWRLYLVVLIVLTLAWPFCIQLTEGVEIYLPVGWAAAAAAYAIGLPILPLVWLSA